MMKKMIAAVAAVLAVALFALNALGDARGWYDSILYFDKYMHFLGGAFIFFVIVLFLTRRMPSVPSFSQRRMRRIVLAVVVIGILWEMYEYIVQHFTGVLLATPVDSVGDLLFDMLGAVAAGIILFFMQKRYNRAINAIKSVQQPVR